MKKRIAIVIITIFFTIGISYCLYPRFFSPIYIWEQSNSPSKLISNNGTIYREINHTFDNQYKYGRQIGRTADGLEIYKIEKGRISSYI